jgi:hypothetical protein
MDSGVLLKLDKSDKDLNLETFKSMLRPLLAIGEWPLDPQLGTDIFSLLLFTHCCGGQLNQDLTMNLAVKPLDEGPRLVVNACLQVPKCPKISIVTVEAIGVFDIDVKPMTTSMYNKLGPVYQF